MKTYLRGLWWSLDYYVTITLKHRLITHIHKYQWYGR